MITVEERLERKKKIRKMRSGKNRKSLREVAEILDISYERVRQIDNQIDPKAKVKTRMALYLKIYHYQEKYFSKHQRYASMEEMVRAGFGGYRDRIRFLYRKMEAEGMLELRSGVHRGLRLLPLKGEELETVVKPVEEAQ